jgi:hypothetical protein
MNSWNRSTAPAYNLKVYNVIDNDLQDKVFEIMECENFYDKIDHLIQEFDEENNHKYQAGFNGKSGGYLVLYIGGKHEDGQVYTKPGISIDEKDVPADVLKRFRRLAVDIVKTTEELAKSAEIEEVPSGETVKLLIY